MNMKSGWYVLLALWIVAAGAGAGYAEADPLSIVSIQAVGPGTQNASGPTSASINLLGSLSFQTIDASIAEVHGFVSDQATSGPESFIADVIHISTQVTVSDPSFPDCIVLCPFQVGANFVLSLDGVAGGSGNVSLSGNGSTGLNGAGTIIPFGHDTADGLDFNAFINEGHSHSNAILFLPLGTYFLDLQLSTFMTTPGIVDYSHSFHAFIEPADGVTVSEVTGLMPIGQPSSAPEPETYALMLAGLGALGFGTRRRKQKEAAAA
jgi:PEP-CTERM motif